MAIFCFSYQDLPFKGKATMAIFCFSYQDPIFTNYEDTISPRFVTQLTHDPLISFFVLFCFVLFFFNLNFMLNFVTKQFIYPFFIRLNLLHFPPFFLSGYSIFLYPYIFASLSFLFSNFIFLSSLRLLHFKLSFQEQAWRQV
jgi:hypothetical protein